MPNGDRGMKPNEKRGAGALMQTLRVRTTRRTEMQDVTDVIAAAVRESGCADGTFAGGSGDSNSGRTERGGARRQ